ncbi:hypothetical protein ABMA70_11265 [Halobacteriovorax sp. XZX-3]|uniref:hypothetical protein n=1 Tax=unclassified Halobacteriovorax TaxID=2639665 RepID=UPI00371DDB47
MKKRKVFTYLFPLLAIVILVACLGRGHNLRKIRSEMISDQSLNVGTRAPASTFVEGEEEVVIGNFFDITQKNSLDDTVGFIQEGNWFQDTLKGYQGSISRYTNDPGARAIYVTDLLGDSTYCIWYYRVPSMNATDNAIIDIFDGVEEIGLANFSLRLQSSEKGLYPLGEFSFTSGQESRVILSKGAEDPLLLRADEVVFKKLGDYEDCQGIIYKDLDESATIMAKAVDQKTFKGTDGYREYGDWVNSKLKGADGNIVRMSEDEYAYSTYNFMPSRTNYCLQVYRPTIVGALSNVKVSIFQEDVEIFSTFVSYNMQSSKSGWVNLGKHEVEADKVVTVIFERDPLDIGLLLSDAVRFIQLSKDQSCD